MKKQIWPVLALSLLTACGSDKGVDPPPVSPPPTPDAVVTATGDGDLVLHPSIDPAYAIAMEAPIRLTETAGGSADWNFARMSLRLGGNEIERSEMGASALRSSGLGPITARSNRNYPVVFRFNSSDFDDVQITLGFGDTKDGRQFTASVPLETFHDVNLSFTPMSLRWSKVPR